MKITIDCRENKLIEEVKSLISAEGSAFKAIEIATENLLLGDINIQAHSHNILIERKTVDDLLASIKDGRYDEQSYRLQSVNNNNNCKVYYFIEGKIRKCHQMTYSSLLSLNYFKGFSVMRTDDLKETASMMLYMTLKLNREADKKPHSCLLPTHEKEVLVEKEGEEELPQPPPQPQDDIYPSLIQKKKNDNITVQNFAEIVLCQIPLVNHTYASVIMKQYKNNLNTLIEALKTDPTCLDNITYTTQKAGKVRKISKTCLQNIIKFLCPDNN